ncbi:hypothetical protein A3Q56_01496 [Intoshia linei]|uniref:Uncharacterized protein n=1 Tax=Intoshia linei TaxID=1819745 RepID=A0A177BBG4_9BILA|nr:hypothetical protein A3Q56_01496 [Intoshia linei]
MTELLENSAILISHGISKDGIKAHHKNVCLLLSKKEKFCFITFDEKTGKISDVNKVFIKFENFFSSNIPDFRAIKFDLQYCVEEVKDTYPVVNLNTSNEMDSSKDSDSYSIDTAPETTIQKISKLCLMISTEVDIIVFQVTPQKLTEIFHRNAMNNGRVICSVLSRSKVAYVTSFYKIIICNIFSHQINVVVDLKHELYSDNLIFDLLVSQCNYEYLALVSQRFTCIYTNTKSPYNLKKFSMPDKNVVKAEWSLCQSEPLLMTVNKSWLVNIWCINDKLCICKFKIEPLSSKVSKILRYDVNLTITWLTKNSVIYGCDKLKIIEFTIKPKNLHKNSKECNGEQVIENSDSTNVLDSKIITLRKNTKVKYCNVFCFNDFVASRYLSPSENAISVFNTDTWEYKSMITILDHPISDMQGSNVEESWFFIASGPDLKIINCLETDIFSISDTKTPDKSFIYKISSHPFREGIVGLVFYKNRIKGTYKIIVYDFFTDTCITQYSTTQSMYSICWAPSINYNNTNKIIDDKTNLSLFFVDNIELFELPVNFTEKLASSNVFVITVLKDPLKARSTIYWSKKNPKYTFIGNVDGTVDIYFNKIYEEGKVFDVDEVYVVLHKTVSITLPKNINDADLKWETVREMRFNDLSDSNLKSHIAACSYSPIAIIFDENPENSHIKYLQGHKYDINSLYWSGFDKNLLATCSKTCIKVWDVLSCCVVYSLSSDRLQLKEGEDIYQLTWCPVLPKVLIICTKFYGIKCIDLNAYQFNGNESTESVIEDSVEPVEIKPSNISFKNNIRTFKDFDELLTNFTRNDVVSYDDTLQLVNQRKLNMTKSDLNILTNLEGSECKSDTLLGFLNRAVIEGYAKISYITLLKQFNYHIQYDWLKSYLSLEPDKLLEATISLIGMDQVNLAIDILICNNKYNLAFVVARKYDVNLLESIHNRYAQYCYSNGNYDQAIIQYV